MGTKNRTTMKDIANHCGISVATVSRVLNENYYVSPEIKEQVLRAMKELHYSPNYTARSLKCNKSGMIGYITSDISNSYHITIAKAIEDVVKSSNYNLIVCSTNNKKDSEEKYLKLLKEQLHWLNRNSDKLYNRSRKLYEKYCNGTLSMNIAKRCCNFKLLEEKCNEYNKISITC